MVGCVDCGGVITWWLLIAQAYHVEERDDGRG